MPKIQTLYFSDTELADISAVAELLEVKGQKVARRLKESLMQSVAFVLEQKHKTQSTQLDTIEKLLEQVHAGIPHLLYETEYMRLCKASTLSDADHKKVKDAAITNVTKYIGQFQTCNYQHNYTHFDTKNFKTLPIENEKNKWKYS